MLRRLVRDSTLYGFANILSAAVLFSAVPFFSRTFPPGDLGRIELLLVAAAFVKTIVPLEITQALGVFLGESKSDEDRRLYSASTFWFSVLGYTLFGVAAWLSAPWLSRGLLGSADHQALVRAAAAAVVLGGVFSTLQNQVRWELKVLQYSASSVAYAVFFVVSAVCLATLFSMGPAAYFYGQCIGSLLGIVFLLGVEGAALRPAIHRVKLGEMLKYSLPLVPSHVLSVLGSSADRLALNMLATLAEVGTYAMAWRIALGLQLVVVGFQGALTPLVLKNSNDPSTPIQVSRIFNYYLLASLGILIAIGLFGREGMSILLPSAYSRGDQLIPILSAAVILSGMAGFAPGLLLKKRTLTLSLVTVLQVLVNVALNWALVPSFGMKGAALALLAGTALATLLNISFSQRLYPIPFAWSRILPGIAAASILYLAASWVDGVSSTSPAVPRIGLKTLSLIVSVVGVSWLLLGSREIATRLRSLRVRL